MKMFKKLTRGGYTSLINPRLSINLERGWNLNKGKGTNQIASYEDFDEGFDFSNNSCPTYSEWMNTVSDGFSISISGSYANNQLVKYSDITLSEASIPISTDMYAGAYGYGVTAAIYCNNKLLVNSNGAVLPQLDLIDGEYLDGSNCDSYSRTANIANTQGFHIRIRVNADSADLDNSRCYLFNDYSDYFNFYNSPTRDIKGNSISTFSYDSSENESIAYFDYYNSDSYVSGLDGLSVYLIVMSSSFYVQT